MAILPSPFGSQANPIRGAGLKRCPGRHPLFLLDPTVARGNEPVTRLGMSDAPPGPPHWMTPLKGLPAPGTRAPSCPVTEPSSSMGEPPGVKALGSKLKACLYLSR